MLYEHRVLELKTHANGANQEIRHIGFSLRLPTHTDSPLPGGRVCAARAI